MAREDCVRLIINNEPVGSDLGIVYGDSAKRDIYCDGPADESFLRLIDALGTQ